MRQRTDFPHLPPGHEPGPQSTRNRQGVPLLWWFVGIVGLGMLVSGVFVAAGGRGDRFDPVEELIGGTFFGAIGLLCALVAYRQYRAFRPRRVETLGGGLSLAVDRDEARRGETVSATITHGSAEQVEVGLVCEERYDLRASAYTKYGNVAVRQTNLGTAHEEWKPVEAASGEQVLTFEIPRAAPCSYEGDCLSYAWRISARQVRELRTDPRLDRPIWVRA